MKKLTKRIFYFLGYEISRVTRNSQPRSIRTNKLTFHRTETGNYYLPTDAVNDVVANAIINNQIFEKEVVDLAVKYIKPNTVVLDVGSNFGQMSVLFSNLVGDNGKVYAFDADDWVFEILNRNIQSNNKEKIIIPHFGAVHNVDNETLIFPEQDFEKYEAYGSYGINYKATEGRKVKSLTIDSLNIEQPISFMKIDIQGGDLQAMQGAIKTIQRHQMPILFEYEYHFEEDYNLCFQDYIDFVQSINYRFYKNINGHNYLIIPR